MRWCVLAILLTVAVRVDAAPSAPCKGCTVALPAKLDAPVPLVVVLHGDRGTAADAASAWTGAVVARGWAVLALQCPKNRGCVDSFWKWDGDPQWVFDQIAALGPDVPIDPKRVYLVGWSGGASWIGWRAQAWDARFAAVVLHGGGIAPRDAGCPKTGLPAYFLVGDHNPLHGLARDLRAYFEGCKADVAWDLVRGGDHEREAAALTHAKADAILDWLAAHART